MPSRLQNQTVFLIIFTCSYIDNEMCPSFSGCFLSEGDSRENWKSQVLCHIAIDSTCPEALLPLISLFSEITDDLIVQATSRCGFCSLRLRVSWYRSRRVLAISIAFLQKSSVHKINFATTSEFSFSNDILSDRYVSRFWLKSNRA